MRFLRNRTAFRLAVARSFRWIALGLALLIGVIVSIALQSGSIQNALSNIHPFTWLGGLIVVAFVLLLDQLDK